MPLLPRPLSAFPDRVRNTLDFARLERLHGAEVSISSLVERMRQLLAVSVEEAFDLDGDGADKKQLVLDAVQHLLDTLLPLVPLPWWLEIVRPLVGPTIRKFLLGLASGWIEDVYERLKLKIHQQNVGAFRPHL